jgi:hypothetical protein
MIGSNDKSIVATKARQSSTSAALSRSDAVDVPVLPAARSTLKPISHWKALPMATPPIAALRDNPPGLQEKPYHPKGVTDYDFG